MAQITGQFPFWFCKNYRRYAGREEEMPFDQNVLLALYIASATEDEWADPPGEFLGTVSGFSGTKRMTDKM